MSLAHQAASSSALRSNLSSPALTALIQCIESNRTFARSTGVRPGEGRQRPAAGSVHPRDLSLDSSSRLRRLVARLLFSLVWALALVGHAESPADSNALLEAPSAVLWNGGVGDGFLRGAQSIGLTLGPGFGMTILGSEKAHDWGLANFQYGAVITDLLAEDHWFRGNLEFGGQLFGAGQYRPDAGFLVGSGPFLRYDLATGSRWVPFIQAGVGLAATDIRNGDLSTTFEFALQAGVGLHYFLRDNLAFTLQYLFIHISNAGIDSPNLGLNNSTFLLGLTCYF